MAPGHSFIHSLTGMMSIFIDCTYTLCQSSQHRKCREEIAPRSRGRPVVQLARRHVARSLVVAIAYFFRGTPRVVAEHGRFARQLDAEYGWSKLSAGYLLEGREACDSIEGQLTRCTIVPVGFNQAVPPVKIRSRFQLRVPQHFERDRRFHQRSEGIQRFLTLRQMYFGTPIVRLSVPPQQKPSCLYCLFRPSLAVKNEE